MDSLAAYLSSLALPAPLLVRLTADSPTSRQPFYRELPRALAPAFPGIAAGPLDELRTGNFLYFLFVLVLDDLLDGDLRLPAQQAQLLLHLDFHARAIQSLAALFPLAHPFWAQLTACEATYRRALYQEQQGASEWDQQACEQLAADKAAIAEVLAHALHYLSPAPDRRDAVIRLLRHYHIASQYEDDVLDFRPDWQAGTRTYVQAQVLPCLREAGPVPATDEAGARYAERFLYASGIAEQHLLLALAHYEQAADQLDALGLPEPAAWVRRHAQGTAGHLERARQLVTEAQQQARAQLLATS